VQLQDKLLLASILLLGVQDAKHNGGSGKLVLAIR
jgi:hypothetical protein